MTVCCPNGVYSPLVIDCCGNTRPLQSNELLRATLAGDGTVLSASDLIAWWRFAETTGSVAADSGGGGYDLTFGSAPTWSNGSVQSVNNNASTAADVDALDLPAEFSIFCKLKLGTVSDNFGGLFGKATNATWSDGWGMWVDSNGDLEFYLDHYLSGSGGQIVGYAIGENKNRTICITATGTVLKLYVDGALVDEVSQSGAPTATAAVFQLGYLGQVTASLQVDDCTYYDLRIFDKAGSPQDVLAYHKDSLTDPSLGTIGDESFSVLCLEDTSAPAPESNAVKLFSQTGGDYWALCDNVSFGTSQSLSSSDHSGILSGELHSISLSSSHVTICGGFTNDIEDSTNSTIAGGATNTIDSSNNATITGGINHTINLSAATSICGGSGNTMTDVTAATIGGGFNNLIDDSDYAYIGGGFENNITSTVANDSIYSCIAGGRENDIIDSFYVSINGGLGNIVQTSSDYSTVCGGQANIIASSLDAVICGGFSNDISGSNYAVVCGGLRCDITAPTVSAERSAIVGGVDNLITDSNRSFIGGGDDNELTGQCHYSAIISGQANRINGAGTHNVICGGQSNDIQSGADWAFIGGGLNNVIDTAGFRNIIVSGSGNLIQTSTGGPDVTAATIVGGIGNIITDSPRAVINGGDANVVTDSDWATVVGGRTGSIIATNQTSDYSVIGGGQSNLVDDSLYAVICGGFDNEISGGAVEDSDRSFIGGGSVNLISDSIRAAIVGGNDNDVIGGSDYGFVGGGLTNAISSTSIYAAIVGGTSHVITATSDYSFIGGGENNDINNCEHSSIVGGSNNSMLTNADHSVILGGDGNTITAGDYSIAGGRSCEVDTTYCVATGFQANAVLLGQRSHSAGQFSAVGDAQCFELITRRSTTDATATQLLLDGSTLSVTMPDNSAWQVTAQVVAMRDDGTEAAGYVIHATLRKDGAANPVVVGTNTSAHTAEDAAAWSAVLNVSGANPRIVVTGEAAKNIRWVATWRVTQVIGG